MTLTLRQLLDAWGTPQGGSFEPDALVGRVCTDSRQLQAGDFFVPLVGERFDGHHFLAQLPEHKVQAAVVSRSWTEPLPSGLLHWRVDDTLLAYQQLALLHRRALAKPLVAVTGSAGKTTTRELIRAALAPLGAIQASEGNNNNDVGVPLTVLGATAADAALVIEMGMRGPGEIERLSRCTEPDLAVITNIGTAHIGRLGSREAIAAAKCEITAGLHPKGTVVIPAGDPLLESALAAVWSGRVLRVRLADDPEVESDLVGDVNGHQLLIGADRLPLQLEGRHNARNLLLAVAVAEQLGVSRQALQAMQVTVPGGRNRRLQQGGLTLLDETYNASPEAVLAALELLAAQPGRRFAVLGTMLELGERSLELHRQVAERAVQLGLDGVVLVDGGAEGKVMAEVASSLPKLQLVASPEDAAAPLAAWLDAGDVLLLKASRGVALERLIPLLPRF
ncbi:UDP-N-acetylmuramoyl-tripeptide--D-alanyl-D-alanine ligase [Synechococcus sp. A15-44]|uniref:UDP-N-acetylmuramoyl-tripeptide--D-alanyl-D- alanine ligase n=1 Tax=Synechococcus sp. A15-44 TaxID=1050646 RepID=UPI001645AEF6|nr:UDP-N-acetylmuramoyl-tripeptide--D-alanyl-D-alanine ligase [Synechococcus sp. A15-44]QNI64220.1 UDP-N-acetylmuramoyl-tripeptide--D-alanyl-D-alanine ligase [Synechococcus sp. A15-44]